jgi:hypothetical protein
MTVLPPTSITNELLRNHAAIAATDSLRVSVTLKGRSTWLACYRSPRLGHDIGFLVSFGPKRVRVVHDTSRFFAGRKYVLPQDVAERLTEVLKAGLGSTVYKPQQLKYEKS